MAFTKSLRKSFLGLLAFVIVLLYVLGAVELPWPFFTLVVRAGTVYGIAAFAIWEMIMVMQAGVRPFFRSHITTPGGRGGA
jgi:hypothetical protein